ncbi:MAG TPA: hypothetical protein VF132_01095, partial [Rudaea sp.]
NPAAGAIDSTAFKLPPEEEFAVIHERPLFNEDRKPAPIEVADTNTEEVKPPPALSIALTGTVRAPNVNMVLVRDKAKSTPVAVKEGMSLPGELSAWTLTKVKSRSAIFKSIAGEEVEVELSVASGGPKAGNKPGTTSTTASAPPPGTPAAFGPGPAPGSAPQPKGEQSADLQKRIEERRQQMREAAERNRKQNQQQSQPQGQ